MMDLFHSISQVPGATTPYRGVAPDLTLDELRERACEGTVELYVGYGCLNPLRPDDIIIKDANVGISGVYHVRRKLV